MCNCSCRVTSKVRLAFVGANPAVCGVAADAVKRVCCPVMVGAANLERGRRRQNLWKRVRRPNTRETRTGGREVVGLSSHLRLAGRPVREGRGSEKETFLISLPMPQSQGEKVKEGGTLRHSNEALQDGAAVPSLSWALTQ